jgi:hypothetical protein
MFSHREKLISVYSYKMNFKDLEMKVLGISTRTIATGVIGAGATYYFLPENRGAIEIMGYDVPSWLIFGGVYAVAGGVNEGVRDWMKEKKTPGNWIYEYSPVSTGIVASASLYLVGLLAGAPWRPSMNQILTPFVIGGVSDYSAMLLTDSIINPIMDVKNIANIGKNLIPEPHTLENFPGNLNTILGNQILF